MSHFIADLPGGQFQVSVSRQPGTVVRRVALRPLDAVVTPRGMAYRFDLSFADTGDGFQLEHHRSFELPFGDAWLARLARQLPNGSWINGQVLLEPDHAFLDDVVDAAHVWVMNHRFELDAVTREECRLFLNERLPEMRAETESEAAVLRDKIARGSSRRANQLRTAESWLESYNDWERAALEVLARVGG